MAELKVNWKVVSTAEATAVSTVVWMVGKMVDLKAACLVGGKVGSSVADLAASTVVWMECKTVEKKAEQRVVWLGVRSVAEWAVLKAEMLVDVWVGELVE